MELTMYYATILFGGILGIITQSLIKINAINSRVETATFKSVLKMYLKKDFINICISLVAVIIYAYVSNEFLYIDMEGKNKDFFKSFSMIGDIIGYYQSFFKTVSVGVGYCANSIIMATLGRTEKWLKTQQ